MEIIKVMYELALKRIEELVPVPQTAHLRIIHGRHSW